MSAANRRLKNEPGTLERVNTILAQDGISYGGGVQVKHLLWIAVRDIGLTRVGETVQSPFRNFRIAPFYGCYMLRPSWELGFDDPENPSSLEKLFSPSAGNRSPMRAGPSAAAFYHSGEGSDRGGHGRHQYEGCEGPWRGLHGDSCPLCHMSLDIYQERAGQAVKTALNLPILHLPQLLGLAMGLLHRTWGSHAT